MKHSTQTKGLKLGLLLSSIAVLVAVPSRADSSYSYARVVEGSATVIEAGGERQSLDSQEPILVGDQLWVPYNSRLEVVLSDRTVLRIEGESELFFDRIAYSSDSQDRTTVLRLAEGNIQLVVPDYALGDTLPQLETTNATIYIHREGSFRIAAGRNGWTELVVREGLAELVTDSGSLLVHPGEMGLSEGRSRPRLDLRTAGYRDSLERWGDRLTEEAALAEHGYVDESLRYAAAPLAHHGTWVSIDSRRVWRPRVEVSWRPYYRGYWRHTPIGLTWVSHDPWGWVTHHYGSWDYVRGYGWVWYPGPTFAPARVHWYWGPDFVGWCPRGYYAHHYRRHHVGFSLHFGHYGWAGGSWDIFGHWSFTAVVNFGHRDRHRHVYSGHELARAGRRLERGIITADPGSRRRSPHEVFADLKREVDRSARAAGRKTPDVSDFVGRKPLSDDVARTILRQGEDRSDRSTASTRYPVIKAPRPSELTKDHDSIRRTYGAQPRFRYDDRAAESRTSENVLTKRADRSDERTSAPRGRTPTISTERRSRPGADESSYRDRDSGKRDDVDFVGRPAPADRSNTLRSSGDRSSSLRLRTPSTGIERRSPRPSSDESSYRDRSSGDRSSSSRPRTPSVQIERRSDSKRDSGSRYQSSRPSGRTIERSRPEPRSSSSSRSEPQVRRESSSHESSSRASSESQTRSRPERKAPPRSRPKPQKSKKEKG